MMMCGRSNESNQNVLFVCTTLISLEGKGEYPLWASVYFVHFVRNFQFKAFHAARRWAANAAIGGAQSRSTYSTLAICDLNGHGSTTHPDLSHHIVCTEYHGHHYQWMAGQAQGQQGARHHQPDNSLYRSKHITQSLSLYRVSYLRITMRYLQQYKPLSIWSAALYRSFSRISFKGMTIFEANWIPTVDWDTFMFIKINCWLISQSNT